MAWLSKRSAVAVLVPLALIFLAALVAAQDVQTPSEVIDPILQTPSLILQPMIDIIESNASVSEEEAQLLIDAFSAVIEDELLSLEQAVEMLEQLGWSTLETEDEIALALALLSDILAGVAAGEIEDPIAALTEAYNASLTPDGIVNAVTKAGASDETIIQVQSLVASGLPPGIALRVTRTALSEGLTQEESDAMLGVLAAAYADDASPGQAANLATEQGSYKYEEQEQEENANQEPSEDPEKEENKNGSRKTSNGKSQDRGSKKG